MIWIIITVLLFVGAVICAVFCEKGCLDHLGCGLFGASIITAIVTAIVTIISTGMVLHHQTSLLKIERNLVIAKEQFETQVKVIQTMASRYPLEANLFTKLDPALLLKLPEIRSNELLLAEIELALKYKDNIYNLRYRRSAQMQALDFHSHRWFSPTLASPKYSGGSK